MKLERCLWIPLVLVPCLAGAGCEQIKRTYAERVDLPDDPVVPPRTTDFDSDSVAGSQAYEVKEFCTSIALRSDARSIGVLPPALRDTHGNHTVTELGELLADEIAHGISGVGWDGWALTPAELIVRLGDMNVDPVTLYDLPSVVAHGDRLGVDAVVFGVLEERDLGRMTKALRVRLYCFDLLSGRQVAESRFDIRSDDPANRLPFSLIQEASPIWLASGEWSSPASRGSLESELAACARVLAERVVGQLDAIAGEGVIYVAPADSSQFVEAIADLRSAQSAFASEYVRRIEESMATDQPLDTESPIVINDTEFPDLQQAEAWLTSLREDLFTSAGARFCQTTAAMVTESMRPLVSPSRVINDLGFTKFSDSELSTVEGMLATGGLARSLKARNMLLESGIDVVVAPRFERIGKDFALRAEVYDLHRSDVAGSTHCSVDPRFAEELAASLGADSF